MGPYLQTFGLVYKIGTKKNDENLNLGTKYGGVNILFIHFLIMLYAKFQPSTMSGSGHKFVVVVLRPSIVLSLSKAEQLMNHKDYQFHTQNQKMCKETVG